MNRPRNYIRPGGHVQILEGRTMFDASTSLDPTFGVDGKVRNDVAGLFDVFDAVHVLPDGKILVAGRSTFGLTTNLPENMRSQLDEHPWIAHDARGVLMRLLPDGTPDQTFGVGGVAHHHSDPYAYADWRVEHQRTRIDEMTAIAVQPDGKIVVGGSGHAFRDPPPGTMEVDENGNIRPRTAPMSDAAFALARYNPDGTIDGAFGANGVAVADMVPSRAAGVEEVEAIALQDDGRIVAVGRVGTNTAAAPDSDMGVVRFNADGSVDESFGRRLADFGRVGQDSRFPWTEAAHAVVIQPDGKVLVGGAAWAYGTSVPLQGFAMVRYGPDGTPDASFGNGGYLLSQFSVGSAGAGYLPSDAAGELHDLALQADGKILAAGRLGLTTGVVARYNGDGSRDDSFGADGFTVLDTFYFARYDVTAGADGTAEVTALGTAEPSVHVGQEAASIPLAVSLSAYTARLDAAGSLLEARHADQLPARGMEKALGWTRQPDGKLVVVGVTFPAIRGDLASDREYQTYLATADALVARLDPSLMPVQPPAEGGGGRGPGRGGEDAIVVRGHEGESVVRRGKVYTFKFLFATVEEARRASVEVSGPNDFATTVQPVRVKAKKVKSPYGGRVTLYAATYRLAAPGGRFDAADNGAYELRPVGTSDAGLVRGSFQVNAAERRSRTAGRVLAPAAATDELRDPSGR